MSNGFITIRERINIFFEQIILAPLQDSVESALELMFSTFSSIEDRAGIVNTCEECPARDKDRMTIPQMAFWVNFQKNPKIYSVCTTGEILYVAENGAIQICATYKGKMGEIILAKPGKDGQFIEHLIKKAHN